MRTHLSALIYSNRKINPPKSQRTQHISQSQSLPNCSLVHCPELSSSHDTLNLPVKNDKIKRYIPWSLYKRVLIRDRLADGTEDVIPQGICTVDSGATISCLPLVKCMEWCELLNPLHSWPWLDQQSMWNSTAGRNGSFATTHARQEPWQCGKAPAVSLHDAAAPGISIRPDLHSPSVCCGTWVLKTKHIKIQKPKEILHVCLGYIQEYQYFICLSLLSWEILTSKARLNISPLQQSPASRGSRK